MHGISDALRATVGTVPVAVEALWLLAVPERSGCRGGGAISSATESVGRICRLREPILNGQSFPSTQPKFRSASRNASSA